MSLNDQTSFGHLMNVVFILLLLGEVVIIYFL